VIGRTRRFGLGGGLALLAACFVGAGAWATTNARGGGYDPVIRPSDFVRTIDNRYLPFKPGTTLRYEGNTAGGVERVEIVVLRTTRRILDVNCLVVRDTVTVAGKPEELTFDWYAQDRRGNVWYFGEDSRDFRNGKWVVSDGSWQAGVDGAKPGIVMLARPRAGRSYRQEYYPGHAEDMARVVGSVKREQVLRAGPGRDPDRGERRIGTGESGCRVAPLSRQVDGYRPDGASPATATARIRYRRGRAPCSNQPDVSGSVS